MHHNANYITQNSGPLRFPLLLAGLVRHNFFQLVMLNFNTVWRSQSVTLNALARDLKSTGGAFLASILDTVSVCTNCWLAINGNYCPIPSIPPSHLFFQPRQCREVRATGLSTAAFTYLCTGDENVLCWNQRNRLRRSCVLWRQGTSGDEVQRRGQRVTGADGRQQVETGRRRLGAGRSETVHQTPSQGVTVLRPPIYTKRLTQCSK